jgi:hypothetical protein
MQQEKYVSGICVGMVVLLLAGCGSTSNKLKTPITGINKRVLLSNIVPGSVGDVMIIDAQKNVFSSKTIGVTQPSRMVTAGGQTVILNSTMSQISVFDNSTEQVTATTPMQGQPFDVAISPDGLTGYAAIKDVGVVEVVNTSSGNIVGTVTVPSPARLVEGPKGHKLLAFSDSPPGGNTFFVIDTATNTATAVSGPALDQPFTGVFDPSDANDTTAFILNCGPECGGTVASVVKVSFGGAPTFTASIPVSGATVGLLNGSSLFVAGTPTTPPAGCTLAACGTLQVINTASLTAGAPINVTDGAHVVMAITSSNRLYVGAAGCTVGPVSAQNTVQGCLSIFNTGSLAVIVPSSESSFRQNFSVTSLQLISGSNVIYVVQGGELDIFDINTDAPSTSITQLDVVGKAIEALQIDP